MTDVAYPVVQETEFNRFSEDDLRHSIECRLRWYGMKNFVLKGIKSANDTEVVAEIADLDRLETYCEKFETGLLCMSKPAGAVLPLAS